MCTLLVAWRCEHDRPLVVAANRDEKLSRPAAPPRAWTDRPLRLFAPEDLEAGGTWMGLNEAGLFVGLTNRYAGGPSPGLLASARRSRGLLVLDALEQPSARAAFDRLRRLAGHEHNPFHLVMADIAGAFLLWSDGDRLVEQELAPGLHVVTERSFDAAPSGRERALAEDPPPLPSLRSALAVHREPGFDGTCVHVEGVDYGTRSAALIEYDGRGPARFEYADGPPCVTPWTDLSEAMERAFSSPSRC
jgi:uncharacterized protein with NRDE domain